MKRALLVLILVMPGLCMAQSLFMSDMAGDRELPLTWGVGGNFFTMDQDYILTSLQFDLPGIVVPDPSALNVRNEVWHLDAKLDVWVLPFLNVFVVGGKIDGDTTLDVTTLGLPIPIDNFLIDYDGESYGVGATFAGGGDRWFASLTAVASQTNLGGNFESDVEAFTLQPRIGMLNGPWRYWVGGFYLSADETHRGSIELPFLGQFNFGVELEEAEEWNFAAGVGYEFNKHFNAYLELGGGDRDHTLFYVGYRF